VRQEITKIADSPRLLIHMCCHTYLWFWNSR